MRKPESTIDANRNAGVNDDELGDTAVFFDFENIVLGVKGKFRPARVVEHLSSRGNVHIRRAYADWGRYSRFQSDLLELGVEMVFLPSYGLGDKNRTDTAVAVDAMETMFLRENIETFVIVSGDSDFGVLARKLRGYGKRVIGISAKSSASKVLAAVCHEFIFYESLTGEALQGYTLKDGEALIRRVLPDLMENRDDFQPSLLKDRMRKVDSTFHERNFGFQNFLSFVESYPQLLEIRREPGGRARLIGREVDRDGVDRPRKPAPADRDFDDRPRRPTTSDRDFNDRPRRATTSDRDTDDRARRPAPSDRPRRPRQRRAPAGDKPQTAPAREEQSDRRHPRQTRPAAASDSARTEKPAPKPRVTRASRDEKVKKAALDAFRVLLGSILNSESEPITLARLRKRLIESVPTFDHTKLGYERFIEFVRAQEDIATIQQQGRSYRVAAA
ncbi:MAG: hypothetical protein ACI9OJ_004087 [Myxococcota bacterium]|jgi:hypothetical protein